MIRLALIVMALAGLFAALMPPLSTPSAETSVQPLSAERRAVLDEVGYKSHWNAEELVIPRAPGGQFRLPVAVNDRDMDFHVDTGADTVAITVETARDAGIFVDELNFEPVGHGASGVTYGQPVVIASLNVGGRQFEKVDAVVLDGLRVNLLGQSILRQFDSVSIEGDRMVIR